MWWEIPSYVRDLFNFLVFPVRKKSLCCLGALVVVSKEPILVMVLSGPSSQRFFLNQWIQMDQLWDSYIAGMWTDCQVNVRCCLWVFPFYVSCLVFWLLLSVNIYFMLWYIYSVASCSKYRETRTCWQQSQFRIKFLLTLNSVLLYDLEWIRSLFWSFRIALFI